MFEILRPICAARSIFRDCFGGLGDNLLIKLYVGKYEAENSQGNRFHQEEPMWEEWVARGQPTCSVLRL